MAIITPSHCLSPGGPPWVILGRSRRTRKGLGAHVYLFNNPHRHTIRRLWKLYFNCPHCLLMVPPISFSSSPCHILHPHPLLQFSSIQLSGVLKTEDSPLNPQPNPSDVLYMATHATCTRRQPSQARTGQDGKKHKQRAWF